MPETPTTEIVLTFLHFVRTPGAPVTFHVRPLVFVVPSEDTERVTEMCDINVTIKAPAPLYKDTNNLESALEN